MNGSTRQKCIHISDGDLAKLRRVLAEERGGRNGKHLRELERELNRAEVLHSGEIPPDLVTMHSRVLLEDVDSGKEMEITLTFPSEAEIDKNMISVLAPIGTAIIGYRKGDLVEWDVPAGTRRFLVKDLLYQPRPYDEARA